MTTAPERGARRHGLRRVTLATAGVLAAIALAACGSIPTSGPVGSGDAVVSEPGPVVLLAYGPPDGAAPQEIVQGFLQAGAAGSTDNFAVAREYLTGDAQSSWDPRAQVVVYSSKGTPQLTAPSKNQVHLSYPVAATVDATGLYSELAPDARWELTFDLVTDASGQWRISALPDGVLVSEPNFTSVYRSTPIYFVSKDKTYLVPEYRWFPQRTIVTSAVSALLAGPSAALRDSVETDFPEGVVPTVNGVAVDSNGTALVDLSGPLLSANVSERRIALAQLEGTLLRLPGVRAIQVSVAGVPMPDVAPASLIVDPSPGAPLVVIGGDHLQTLTGTTLAPVTAVGSLAGLDARSPAQSSDGAVQVLLSGPDRLVLAPSGEKGATPLLTGISLLAPSVDRLGWIWTGSSVPGASLVAVKTDGTTAAIPADWLAERTVRSVRVSRDAARVAVVSVGQDGVTVDVAAVVRDGSGRPVRLDSPIRVGYALTDASSVVWVDEANLAVLGRTASSTALTPFLLPISGRLRALPVLDGAISIAAGKGERSLFLGTADGSVFTLQGQSWRKVAQGVSGPAFPG
jgi:hypothetical protein